MIILRFLKLDIPKPDKKRFFLQVLLVTSFLAYPLHYPFNLSISDFQFLFIYDNPLQFSPVFVWFI